MGRPKKKSTTRTEVEPSEYTKEDRLGHLFDFAAYLKEEVSPGIMKILREYLQKKFPEEYNKLKEKEKERSLTVKKE